MKTENGQKPTIGKAKQINEKKTIGTQKKRELNITHFFFLKIKVLFGITLKDKLTPVLDELILWYTSQFNILLSRTNPANEHMVSRSYGLYILIT